MSKSNIVDPAEVAERLDGGHRLALVEAVAEAETHERPADPTLTEALETETTGLDGVNIELTELVLSYMEDARQALKDARRMADRAGDPIAHVAISREVERVGDLNTVLTGRWSA